MKKAEIKTTLGIVRNASRRTFNNRTWGAGTVLFDPELENVLILNSKHNKLRELPGGGLGIISRLIERTRGFEDPRGVVSVPSMRATAKRELEEETGITKDELKTPFVFVDSYYGQRPRDTYTAFGAVATAHLPIEELILQADEIDTTNDLGALWVPRHNIADLGPIHFALEQGVVTDAHNILHDYLSETASISSTR